MTNSDEPPGAIEYKEVVMADFLMRVPPGVQHE